MKLLLINLSVNDNGPAIIHSNGNKVYIKIITSISSTQQEVEIDDNDYDKLTKSFMVEFKGINYYGVTYQTYNNIPQQTIKQPEIVIENIISDIVDTEIDYKPFIEEMMEKNTEPKIIDDLTIDYNTTEEPIIEVTESIKEPIIETKVETAEIIEKLEIPEELPATLEKNTIQTPEKVQPIKQVKKKPVKKDPTKEQSEDLYIDKTTDLYLDQYDDLYTE